VIVAYLGNHRPTFSTESHIAEALETLGHDVIRLQEGEIRAVDVPSAVMAVNADFLLWTQTYGLAVSGGTLDERHQMIEVLRDHSVPTVGYHLDRWWGLDRQDQISVEPFFRVNLLCTADGGHDDEWRRVGINHRWFPPAVAGFDCRPQEPRAALAADVAFVGSWRGGYHPEWTHRPRLVEHLRTRWNARFWPAHPNQPVRGALLNAVYASTKVVVGDSCLIPRGDGPLARYWSDRIPETLGRGGFLVHPWVDGIDEHFTDGKHLALWLLGQWDELDATIAYYLANADEREEVRRAGRAHVLEHHTYEVRMQQLEHLLRSEGMI